MKCRHLDQVRNWAKFVYQRGRATIAEQRFPARASDLADPQWLLWPSITSSDGQVGSGTRSVRHHQILMSRALPTESRLVKW